MRLLHAGLRDLRNGVAQRQPGPERRPDPRRPVRQHLPVHRLSGDRQGGARCGRRDEGPTMSTPTAGSVVPSAAARYIGQSVSRKEDRRLLTGHGQYVDDISVPGMLHAAFFRSEHARGTITRVDIEAALALPGVVAIYTWSDFDGQFGEAWHAMLGEELQVPPPLAIGDVRHVGDPIAIVVAASRYIAEDACDLIEVDIDVQQAVVEFSTAHLDTDNIVHSSWGLTSNAMVAVPFTPMSPDLAQAFTDAAHVVECTIRQNRYISVPMEGRGV